MCDVDGVLGRHYPTLIKSVWNFSHFRQNEGTLIAVETVYFLMCKPNGSTCVNRMAWPTLGAFEG